MALHNDDNEVTEAVEVVDAMPEVEALEDVDDAEAFDDGAVLAAGAAEGEDDDGPSIYTVLMIISTVAYAAATVMALVALKQYCSPEQWPLW